MKKCAKSARRYLARQEGAAAVEFALVLAVLVPLLFGTFELGRALHTRNALDYLADRAARSLLVEHRRQLETLQANSNLSDLEALLLDEAKNRTVGINPDTLAVSLTISERRLAVRVNSDMRLLIPFFPVPEIFLSAGRSLSLFGP